MLNSIFQAVLALDGYRQFFLVVAVLGMCASGYELLDRKWHLKKWAIDVGLLKYEPRGFSVAWLPQPLMFWRDWDFHHRWWWKIRPWVQIIEYAGMISFVFYWPQNVAPSAAYKMYILIGALLLAAMWLWRGYRSWSLAISKVRWLNAGNQKNISDRFILGTNWPELSTKTAVCTTLALLFWVSGMVAFIAFGSPHWAFRLCAAALLSYLYVALRFADWQKQPFRGLAKPAAIEVSTHYLLGYAVLVMLVFA